MVIQQNQLNYKPYIHQSMKEKHHICVSNIKSRFNHGICEIISGMLSSQLLLDTVSLK